MIPVQLESPYAGAVHRNKAYLQLCILDCVFRGEAPFCSHQMYTESLDDLDPLERKLGIEAGLVWGAFAQKSVVYHDFGISGGMQIGINNAKMLNRPIEMRELPWFDPSEFFTEFDRETDTFWAELLSRALSKRNRR